mmetsp:Transcript_41069/g.118081  ORF Transcript_41069/g.118081 Transcript_41069/m.118081 type:complete len:187 (-) Transcript_41069:162-722(-)
MKALCGVGAPGGRSTAGRRATGSAFALCLIAAACVPGAAAVAMDEVRAATSAVRHAGPVASLTAVSAVSMSRTLRGNKPPCPAPQKCNCWCHCPETFYGEPPLPPLPPMVTTDYAKELEESSAHRAVSLAQAKELPTPDPLNTRHCSGPECTVPAGCPPPAPCNCYCSCRHKVPEKKVVPAADAKP